MNDAIQIIEKAPFVKGGGDAGFRWSFHAIDPATNRPVDASISPYALLHSLGEKHGEQELLTCSCGDAGCAGISQENFACAEKYVRWSFERGTAYSLFFDRVAYEAGAIEMLHDIYVTKTGWKFNAMEYHSYEDFKAEVDEFLAAKPHFKAIWDEIKEVSP